MINNYLATCKVKTLYFLVFIWGITSTNNSFSQCAGTDNSVTICNKESDSSLQNFDLFSQLGGTPQSGGSWVSDSPVNSGALDSNTGILNLWAINRFGRFSFTYQNPTCNESATVTVNLGGYPGEDNLGGGANACSDDGAVNLFTFLDNESIDLRADTNGEWQVDSPSSASGYLNGSFFNAFKAGVGTYKFIYTVGNVETCGSEFATISLEVHRAPESGEDAELIFCQDDDLSPYTNFNLSNLLTGEDNNGIWSESDGTGQIDNASDSIINIQEIYNTLGAGTYKFRYTVLPNHGVCSVSFSIISITILDISGEFLVENQCLDNSISTKIKYVNSEKAALSYDLTYEIVDANNSVVYTDNIKGISMDRETELEITPDNSLSPGNYTIRAATISNVAGGVCSSFTISEDNFTLYSAEATTSKECFEGNNADVMISNFTSADGSSLSNETLLVNYAIKDVDNNVIKIVKDHEMIFSNGSAELPIDVSTFNNNATNFNLTFLEPKNRGLGCINFNFKAILIPEDIKLNLDVDNKCNATGIDVLVDAPTLSNGQYTVTYQITELGSSEVLIDNTIEFVGGKANYQVDITNLEQGDYEVVLKSTQNDVTPCRTTFDFELTEKFSIGGVPEPPVLDARQVFCFSKYEPNGPTIQDIKITSGENLTWYEDITSTVPLNESTLLEDGEDYFVTATNSKNSCQSSERTVVVVSVIKTTAVTSSNTNPVFCKTANATLANLEVNNSNGTTIRWYDSTTDGNLLNTNTLLEDGKSYFATESSGECENTTRLEFNVTVVGPPTPQLIGNASFCALDKPTLLELEEIISSDSSFELIWYDAKEDGNELSNADLIVEGVDYYVANVDTDTSCESERLKISILLSNCDPEQYKFFIPDGFSPNGDGVNDTYYIPNIQYFYPDYELEIFNRYGQILFKGDIDSPAWNGKNNNSGNEATTGVYFYILKYNKDNLKPKQNRIYLSK